jgi:DNA helicase II / ATP-dependent DNA helicase PcrA
VFHADLHIHSRFSRACSKDCEIPNLAWWAARKGITVVGTGDFTHPAWAAELAESLIPAEPGLLRLRPELESRLGRTLPPNCARDVRFMLSTEISTIYKRDDATRKVHHLLYAPTFEAASAITTALAKVGNLASDGRPILGLDSRHLLEITLNAGPGCFLIPAHIWTPWFAVLGSKSGFDTVPECYLDLADHVFAVETGLSSDPPMNWICSGLDRYQLVSNSDAHSPPMLGREATTFGTELDYFAMLRALRTGQGLARTLNFFPEGGRYHLDGHRKCGVRFFPEQSKSHREICPQCGKPLTIGVLHRVAELADRSAGHRPAGAADYANMVSLPEIVGEIRGTGPKSKGVAIEVDRLVATLGPELAILFDTDPAEIGRAGGGLLAEAIARLRRGEVIKEGGYDGEYGVVRLFRPEELAGAEALFDLPEQAPEPGPAGARGRERSAEAGAERADREGRARGRGRQSGQDGGGGVVPPGAGQKEDGAAEGLLAGLDPEQRAAAEAPAPLMIIAGPGTGKTRTLTHRIAAEVAGHGAAPEACLALTFTRRAAQEMRDRLALLLPAQAGRLTITTFHGLGLAILREHGERAGLPPGFTVADEAARVAVAADRAGSAAGGRRLLAAAALEPALRAEFTGALVARGLVDFDALIEVPVTLLREEPDLAEALRQRWRSVSVDEYQDIDAAQHALLRLLTGDGGGLTVIGDPDQAIYGFRGADVGIFGRFGSDYPGARTVQLTRNYRSSPAIVSGALAAVAPSTLVPGRSLSAVTGDGGPAGLAGSGLAGSGLAGSGPPTAGRAGAGRAGAGRAGAGRAGAGRGAARRAGQSVPTRITFHEAADEHAEGAWIAQAIDQVLGGTSLHSLDSGRADGHAGGKIGLADIAVLYRTDAQAGPLGQALSRAGLPFQKRSHDLLGRRTAVPDIVHQMRLAGAAEAAEVAPGEAAGPLGAARADGAGTGPRTSVADRLADAVRRLTARPLGDRAAGGHAPGKAASAVDVLAAGEVLAPLAARCGDDLDRFLTEIALGAEVDALDPRADAVSLLTLHAAKGLEFSVVFVAGCERGLLPLWLPGSGGADLAEERRLLFVGMTRARTHLFLSCARQRRRHGTVAEAGPSQFLAAIAATLLDRSVPRPRRPETQQLRLL